MTNSSCKSFPDNPKQCVDIHKIRISFGSFSLALCLFMIIIILKFKRFAEFEERMILSLSIAALLESIAYIMSYFNVFEHGTGCLFVGWWLTFCGWAVLLWVTGYTLNLWFNVCKRKSTARFEWLYHVLCWGLPIIISLVPLIFTGDWNYGPAGAWCWIDDVDWRWIIWFGPLCAFIALLILAYSCIIYTLRTKDRKPRRLEEANDRDGEREDQLKKEDIEPLLWYPLIYVALSTFPLINSIQNRISPNNNIICLMILASIFSSLHGAGNALAFGLLDKEILAKLWQDLRHRCKCKSEEEEEEEQQQLLPRSDSLQIP